MLLDPLCGLCSLFGDTPRFKDEECQQKPIIKRAWLFFCLSVIVNTKIAFQIAFLVRGLAFIGRLLMGRKSYVAWTLPKCATKCHLTKP